MKHVFATLLAALLLLGTISIATADAPGDLEAFAAANGLYDDGNFAEAARSYERLAALGYDDATLYYNLGNAYHKQGDIGRAILSYLRAKRLEPRDDDLNANLSFVRGQTEDLMEISDSPGALGDLASTLPTMSANELAALALALWIIVMAGLATALLTGASRIKSIAVSTTIGAVVLLALTGLTMAGRSQIDDALASKAVILDELVQVHSGPGVQYPTEFEVHAGAETDLLEVRGAWARIAIASPDLQGWVANTTFEAVLPSPIP